MKPNERDPAVDRLMRGLEPPGPPPDLRSEALAEARKRMADEEIDDVWSTIWNSTGIRWAWAAAVVLFLAGHTMIVADTGHTFGPIDSNLAAENGVDDYLAEMLRPARIAENVQPVVGIVASANRLTELENEGNPS